MENQIEVRIEGSAKSVSDVYFWHNGQRSGSLYLFGPEDEYCIAGNPIPESIGAWVKLMIQRKENGKDKVVWEVMYKTNAVDNELHAALEGVKRKIETAIEKGLQVRIVLNDDLMLSKWETDLPQEPI